MFFLLLILMGLFFVPLKIEISGKIHNLEFEAKFKAVFFYGFPFSVSLFNLRDEPFQWRYRLLGKTGNVNTALKKQKKNKKKNKGEKKDKENKNRAAAKFIRSFAKYIKLLEFICRIGIKDRADTTAILTGCLNGSVYPAAKMSGIKKTKIYFVPQYNMDVFHADFKCIISISAANIIHESIRYYIKRRK